MSNIAINLKYNLCAFHINVKNAEVEWSDQSISNFQLLEQDNFLL